MGQSFFSIRPMSYTYTKLHGDIFVIWFSIIVYIHTNYSAVSMSINIISKSMYRGITCTATLKIHAT